MEKHRKEHLSSLDPDSAALSGSAEEASSTIPEEAAEVYELIEETDPTLPEPPLAVLASPPPVKPEIPEETEKELQALKAKLVHKDKQIEQVMEAYRGKKAETEKLRKRIEKTERRRFEQSKGDFIARFVEVLDNLDRAIDSIENAFDPDSVLQGIMLVRSRLVTLLKEEGLEKIFVRGQIYDPIHSEAAETQAVPDESQDGMVLRELQPGYMLKGSLLRAARVVVGRYGEPKPAQPAPVEPRASVPEPQREEAHSWDAEDSGHTLEFSEDGLDFSGE